NCGTSGSTASGGATTSTTGTASAQSTKANAAAPTGFEAAQFRAAAATTTTTTAKANNNKNNNQAQKNKQKCDDLAAAHAQVQNDLAHDNDVLSVVRSDRTRYEGYVRDDTETLISDHQTVDQDQRDLDDSKNAQKAGL